MSDKIDILYFNKNGECISKPSVIQLQETGWLIKHDLDYPLQNCLAVKRDGKLFSINEECKNLDNEIELTETTWRLANDKSKNKYYLKQPKTKMEKSGVANGVAKKRYNKRGVKEFENVQRISEQALEYIVKTTNEQNDNSLENRNRKRCTIEMSPSKKRYFFIKCMVHEESTASLQIYVDSGMMNCFGCRVKRRYKETLKLLAETYDKLVVVNNVLQVVN